jgi:hypothetical protein
MNAMASGRRAKNSPGGKVRRTRGRHRAPQRHTEAYAWLGAGALTLGVGAALASGSGIAHADSAGSGQSSSSHASLASSVNTGPKVSSATSVATISSPGADGTVSSGSPSTASLDRQISNGATSPLVSAAAKVYRPKGTGSPRQRFQADEARTVGSAHSDAVEDERAGPVISSPTGATKISSPTGDAVISSPTRDTKTSSPTGQAPPPPPADTVISSPTGYTTIEDKYVVQNNAFLQQAGDQQTITATPTGFGITAETYSSGTPYLKGYPSIYLGCFYSRCSPHSVLPERLSQIQTATSSISYTYAPGVYDASYDIWLNPTYTAKKTNQQEVMIWLNYSGGSLPNNDGPATVNSFVGDTTIDGQTWGVYQWIGVQPKINTVFYVATTPITTYNFNVLSFLNDVQNRTNVTNSWYLSSIQAGFEVGWGGVGLAVNSFDVTIN